MLNIACEPKTTSGVKVIFSTSKPSFKTRVVLFVVLALSLIMIPNTADAAVVELKQQDFQEAINHQGTKTAKGLTYEKEGERECFSFDPGEYKLAENIDLGVAFIECRGEYVFDLNGKNISNVGLTALLFINDSDVKVFGNGTIKCISAGISAEDSNVVLEDTTLDSALTFWSDTKEVNLVINNSKVMDRIYVHGENAFATINGGEFCCKEE